MTRRTFDTLLTGPNPFAASRAEGPGALATDVPEVGASAWRTLEGAVRSVLESPRRQSRGVLLLGQPGAGRSHLLLRLVQGGGPPALGAVVRGSLGPPKAVARRVAAALLEAAARPEASGHGSVPRLEAVLRAASERAGWELGARTRDPDVLRRAASALTRLAPELDRRIVRWLLAAREPGAAEALAGWLRGHVGPGESIFVPEESPDEEIAFELVSQLARLAAPERAVVLAFDALEAAEPVGDDARAVRALVALLCRIHDRVPGCVLVCSAEEGSWHRGFAPRLNDSERARLIEDVAVVEALGPDAAAVLVAARVAAHLGRPAKAYPSHPFSPDLFAALCPLGAGDILEVCAREISRMREGGRVKEVQAPTPAGPAAGLASAVRSLYDGRLKEADARPPAPLDEQGTARILERILRAIIGRRLLDDVELTGLEPGERSPLRLVLELTGEGGRTTRVGLAVSEAEKGAFTRDMRRLEEDAEGLSQVLLVRGGPVQESWKKGLEAYERLLDGGMHHLAPDEASARQLAVLERIVREADRGSVEMAGEKLDGGRFLRELARDGVLDGIPLVADLLQTVPGGGAGE